MSNRRTVAYVLIGLGTITLLARLSDGAGWLWIGLVAAAMLFGYARQRTYGLLVLGGILAGTATGILLQEVFRNEAFFLVSLGAGIAAIDLVERRPSRWPRTLGAVLATLGVLIGLANAGAFASVWFALLLIAAGVALISRGPDARPFPPPRTSPAPTSGEASPERPAGGTTAPSSAPATATATATDATASARRAPATASAPEPTPSAPVASGSTSGSTAGSTSGPAPDGAAERRTRLEAWRARTADSEGRASQSILADDVLDEVARRAPSDLNELATVRGIGPVKLERYGADLLSAVRDGAP